MERSCQADIDFTMLSSDILKEIQPSIKKLIEERLVSISKNKQFCVSEQCSVDSVDDSTHVKYVPPDGSLGDGYKSKREEVILNSWKKEGHSHQKILREEHENIVERLDLRSPVLDMLFQNGAITSDDHEKICKMKDSRIDQVRYLLVRLYRYGDEHFLKFLSALDEADVDLSVELTRKYNYMSAYKTRENFCLKCKLRNRVDISDIIDKLYKTEVISFRVFENSALKRAARSCLWKQIFFEMKNTTSSLNPLLILRESMVSKYPDLVADIDNLPSDTRHLSCTCRCKTKYTTMITNRKINDIRSKTEISPASSQTFCDTQSSGNSFTSLSDKNIHEGNLHSSDASSTFSEVKDLNTYYSCNKLHNPSDRNTGALSVSGSPQNISTNPPERGRRLQRDERRFAIAIPPDSSNDIMLGNEHETPSLPLRSDTYKRLTKSGVIVPGISKVEQYGRKGLRRHRTK